MCIMSLRLIHLFQKQLLPPADSFAIPRLMPPHPGEVKGNSLRGQHNRRHRSCFAWMKCNECAARIAACKTTTMARFRVTTGRRRLSGPNAVPPLIFLTQDEPAGWFCRCVINWKRIQLLSAYLVASWKGGWRLEWASSKMGLFIYYYSFNVGYVTVMLKIRPKYAYKYANKMHIVGLVLHAWFQTLLKCSLQFKGQSEQWLVISLTTYLSPDVKYVANSCICQLTNLEFSINKQENFYTHPIYHQKQTTKTARARNSLFTWINNINKHANKNRSSSLRSNIQLKDAKNEYQIKMIPFFPRLPCARTSPSIKQS